MKVVLINLIFALTLSSAFSQSVITGSVIDHKGNGLPYANIGIRGGKTGTVSSVNGTFSITIADSLVNDSLSFSSIGFKDQSFMISSLVCKKNVEIILEEKIISLAEVKINNKKLKQHKLGITGRTPMIYIPTKSFQKTDILEQARLIKLKRSAKILNANIFVLSNLMNDVDIRLNFYVAKDGVPGKRLVEKTIIRKAKIKSGWFRIDLKDENIYLEEDFVVAFEYLPSSQNSIVFAAKLGAADSFFRSSSQGEWRKNMLGGCSIYVTAEM